MPATDQKSLPIICLPNSIKACKKIYEAASPANNMVGVLIPESLTEIEKLNIAPGFVAPIAEILASLIEYGLLERSGPASAPKYQLSGLALQILEAATEKHYLQAIEKAAVMPTLFTELDRNFQQDEDPTAKSAPTFEQVQAFFKSRPDLKTPREATMHSYVNTRKLIDSAAAAAV